MKVRNLFLKNDNIADQINAPLYFADGPDTDINYDMSLVGGEYQK